MRSKRVLLAVNVLLVAILACNLPGGQATATPTGQVDLAATITAQALTLQAPTATAGPTDRHADDHTNGHAIRAAG